MKERSTVKSVRMDATCEREFIKLKCYRCTIVNENRVHTNKSIIDYRDPKYCVVGEKSGMNMSWGSNGAYG